MWHFVRLQQRREPLATVALVRDMFIPGVQLREVTDTKQPHPDTPVKIQNSKGIKEKRMELKFDQGCLRKLTFFLNKMKVGQCSAWLPQYKLHTCLVNLCIPMETDSTSG